MMPLKAIVRAFVGGLGATCLLAASTALAGTIEVLPKPSVYATPDLAGVATSLRIAGMIATGDSDRLRDILMRLTDGRPDRSGLIVAETSGPGGDYYEAMRIGQMLSDFRVVTVVRKGEQCVSACVLAFLGGSAREFAADGTPEPRRYVEVGATMYFRNFYTRRPRGEPQPDYPVQSLIEYSVRMGVDRSFLTRLAALAPDEHVHLASVSDFMLFDACPIGMPPPATPLPEQASSICNNASHWFDPDAPHTTRPVTILEAKRAVMDAARLNTYRARDEKGRTLGQQLAGRTYMDSAEATDRFYDELRGIGVSLPELSGTIFQVSGYRTGQYGMECVVSFAPRNPGKYSVVVATPVGAWLAPMVREVPSSCPDLRRHDGNEVINPPAAHD